jgi:prevent-host-death family protein
MKLTATQAKNRFGQVLEQAQKAPVVIEKSGRRHSVVLSAEQFDKLQEAQRGLPAGTTGDDFYKRYKGWVDEQNRLVETYGVFGAEWRNW